MGGDGNDTFTCSEAGEEGDGGGFGDRQALAHDLWVGAGEQDRSCASIPRMGIESSEEGVQATVVESGQCAWRRMLKRH